MADENVVDLKGRGFRDDGREPEIPDCPITALGHNDGRYFFLSPGGELRELGFRELCGAAGQISLFDGDALYLKAMWPRRSQEGALLDDWNAKHAGMGLVAMCAQAGLWDPETVIRGRGVWRGPDDKLICHSGNSLLYVEPGAGFHSHGRAGLKIGAAIYPAKPRLTPPAAEAATADMAKAWRDDFRWWRFQPLGLGGVNSDRGPDGLAGDLLFGATSLAMLGAAPRWRVHVLVKAVHGAGKSTLIAKIAAALGSSAIVMNNFSEAGLRRSLANEARPVLLDEAEGDTGDGVGTMSQAIRLIRQMSGGDGVRGARGTGAGGAEFFEIAGCAFLFCINPPVLLPQDLSRIVVLDMQRAIPAHERSAYEAISRAGDMSAALRARAFHGWDRFRKNIPILRAALIHLGCNTRQADQLGGLLAASAMMTDDYPVDGAHAADLAEGVVPLIETLRAEEADNSDAMRCWLTLVTRRADVWRSGEGQTIGSLLLGARHASGVEQRKALNDYCGMRLVREDDLPPDGAKSMPEAPCLYVKTAHEFLRTVYRDTPWREGGWATSLSRLSGAAASKDPIRIGGLKQRAVAIPLKHLPQASSDPDGVPDD